MEVIDKDSGDLLGKVSSLKNFGAQDCLEINPTKFSIDDEIHITKIKASGTWSGQEYTIVVDNFFNYKIDMKSQELHSFDYGSCKNLDKI